MSTTKDYYNNNAEAYYWATVGIDFDKMRQKFASYLPSEARIIDMGCGSGRDVLAFSHMGHHVIGLDNAEKLVKFAEEMLEIKLTVGDMSSFVASEPFDGVWCCASLIHLNEKERGSFFSHLDANLKSGGVIYVSVKDGIETGIDEEGRYVANISEAEIRECLEAAGCEILEIVTTEDIAGRTGFKWLNVFARKK